MPGAARNSKNLLTEELIAKKVKAACNNVKALDISGMDLDEVNPAALGRYQSLEILNLSRNNLRALPGELRLCRLRKLDVSENRLVSVEFITQFPALQELYIEQNDLEASDRYIAAALLPSLKVVDQNKIESLSKVVNSTRDKLESESAGNKPGSLLTLCWRQTWLSVDPLLATNLAYKGSLLTLQRSLSSEKEKAHANWVHDFISTGIRRIWDEEFQCDLGECDLEKKLIDKVKESRHHRHVSLAKFSDFMIKHLCREHLQGLRKQRSRRHRNVQTSPEPLSKRRKVQNEACCSSPGKSPAKSQQMDTSPAVSPRMSPRDSSSPKKPAISPGVNESPRKSARKQSKKVPWEEQDSNTLLPPVSDYSPVHFVRCHFGDKKAKKEGCGLNDPADHYTPVWACAFEPNPSNPEETTNIVATCGGHTVCLVDCCTGVVLKRYQNTKMEFYCVAWTTLTMENEGRQWQTNIMAVAGSEGYIKLLHPDQLVCYREFGSNKPKVACRRHMTTAIVFDKDEPELMYCANSDSSVTVWNVGVPSGPDYSTEILPIRTLVSDAGSVQCLISTGTHLLAGCEEAFSVWKFPIGAASNQKRHQAPCARLETPEKMDQSVNSMVLLSDDTIACNVLGSSKIYLWNLSANLKIASKIKQTVLKPLMVLDWVQSDLEDIGLGFRNGVLGCGDDKGNIMLYNLQRALALKHPTTDLLKASRVVGWPECVIDSNREEEKQMVDVTEEDAPVVNCVAFSSGCKYMVAGTDNNLVCIWKKNK